MTKKSIAIGVLVIVLIGASMAAIVAERRIVSKQQAAICQLDTGGCVMPKELSFFPLSPN